MMENESERLSQYTFMESYHDALMELIPGDDKAEDKYNRYGHVMFVINEFVLYGKEPDLSTLDSMERMAWKLISKIAERTRAKAIAGHTGGKSGVGVSRNVGNKANQKQTDSNVSEPQQTEEKQIKSKSIANQKQTASRAKALQKEVKTEKDKEMEKDKENIFSPTTYARTQENFSEFYKSVVADTEYLATICRNLKVTEKSVKRWLCEFDTESTAKGNLHDGGISDYKSHFYDWVRKHVEHLNPTKRAEEQSENEQEEQQRTESANKHNWLLCLQYMCNGKSKQDKDLLGQMQFRSYDSKSNSLLVTVSESAMNELESEKYFPMIQAGLKKFYPGRLRLQYFVKK